MKLLYLGYVINPEICKKYGIGSSGSTYEYSLLTNLTNIYNEDLMIMSFESYAPMAKGRVWIESQIRKDKNIEYTLLHYLNIPVIKQFSQIISAYIKMKRWKKRYKDEEKVILCYNSLPVVSIPTILNRDRACSVGCYMTDYPIDVLNRKGIKSLLWKNYSSIGVGCVRKFDKLMCVNENYNIDFFHKQDFLTVPIGLDTERYKSVGRKEVIKNGKFVVAFAGYLNEYNGVQYIVEAFRHIDNSNLELWIFGDGPYRSKLSESIRTMNNVIYQGRVDNVTMIEMLPGFDLLVNPRDPAMDISKYTYPSKIIEYIYSGVPVVSTRIDCIVKDYCDYINWFDSLDPISMANKVMAIYNNYGTAMGRAFMAKRYLETERTMACMCQRISDYLGHS